MLSVMSIIASIEHIVEDDHGVAWIKDANVKVIEIVLDQQAYGWSPEEIHFQHPHLSLSKIHSALAYYYDHQPQLDREIQRRLEEVDKLRGASPIPPLLKRFRQNKPKAD